MPAWVQALQASAAAATAASIEVGFGIPASIRPGGRTNHDSFAVVPIRSSGSAVGLQHLPDVLRDLRLSATFLACSDLHAPWGLEIPASPRASFHFVVEGGCWVTTGRARDAVRLEAGELAFLPHGRGHVLSDQPGRRAVRFDRASFEQIGPGASVLRHGGGGARSLLMCGVVRFEGPTVHPLVEAMPELVHLGATAGDERRRFVRDLLDAMKRESVSPTLASAVVLTRLADILVIETIRAWLDEDAAERAGWVGALRDPQLGRALALIHRRPEDGWTLASLAREVGMSRSSFSERFTRWLGVGPMQYLTRWRMRAAAEWLRDDRLTVDEAASRLGYHSTPSFSRAFKRHIGATPGAVRANRAGAQP